MNNYIVESHSRWFVVTTKNIKSARSIGCKEFGRVNFKTRKATESETSNYIAWKGKDALRE